MSRVSRLLAFILIGGFLTGCIRIRGVEESLSALLSSNCDTTTMAGDGTANNRYIICSAAQLTAMGTNSAGNFYALGQDIDLSGIASFAPVTGFLGDFTGNGHSIIGQHYSDPLKSNVGLFDRLPSDVVIQNLVIDGSRLEGRLGVGALTGLVFNSGGGNTTIKNVTVKNSVISGKKNVSSVVGGATNVDLSGIVVERATVVGDSNIGLLIGISAANLTITGARVQGIINGGIAVGGIGGYLSGATISDVASYANIFVDPDSAQFANLGLNQGQIGGGFGYIENSDVSNFYYLGSMIDNTGYLDGIGGFAGESLNTVFAKSYSDARTLIDIQAGSDDVYGVLGIDDGGNTFTNAYYNKNAYSPNAANATGASGLTTAEMAIKGNFQNFDFVNHWQMSSGSFNFPSLISQAASDPFNGVKYRQTPIGAISLAEVENLTGYLFPDTTDQQFNYVYVTLKNNSGSTIYLKNAYTALKASFLLATGSYTGTCPLYVTAAAPLFTGQSCTFGVRFNPITAATVPLYDSLIVEYAAGTSTGVSTIVAHKLDGNGVILNPLLADDVIPFPDTIINSQAAPIDYVLSNSGAADGEIISYNINGAGFTINSVDCPVGTVLAVGDTCTVHMGFNPTAIQAYATTLDVVYKNDNTGFSFTAHYALSGNGVPSPFSCGTGILADPWCVGTRAELVSVGSFPSGNFIQTADINLTGCGAPFSPMNSFSGDFNGANHTISNLCSTASVGFVSQLTGGSIHDLNFNTITVDDSDAAAVKTYPADGMMTAVAGIVGWQYNNSTIDHVSVTNATISGGTNATGCLVAIAGEAAPVGHVHMISNSSCSGNITGSQRVGIVVGYTRQGAVINDSYAAGSVTGTSYTGGLIGAANAGSAVNRSYSTANVSGGSYTGGLIGFQILTPVDKCYVTAAATVNGTSQTGGLVGYLNGGSSITNSYSQANVTGTSGNGGLVGQSDGGPNTISKTYATGNVSSVTNSGGLVGSSSGDMISLSYYKTGTVTCTSDTCGGLVGFAASSTIEKSFSNTTTNCGGDGCGALAGSTAGTTLINQCFTIGTVTGVAAGGLVGLLYGSSGIQDSFSTAAAIGPGGFGMAGGLVGRSENTPTVATSYSTGVPSNASNLHTSIGANNAPATVTNVYYYAYAGNPGDLSGAVGLDNGGALPMNVLANFTGFTGVWAIPTSNWNSSLATNQNSPVPLWACDPATANGINNISWSTITGIVCP